MFHQGSAKVPTLSLSLSVHHSLMRLWTILGFLYNCVTAVHPMTWKPYSCIFLLFEYLYQYLYRYKCIHLIYIYIYIIKEITSKSDSPFHLIFNKSWDEMPFVWSPGIGDSCNAHIHWAVYQISKPFWHFIESWLFNRDPYNYSLKSLIYIYIYIWLVSHPLF